jgi:hypothetical protein
MKYFFKIITRTAFAITVLFFFVTPAVGDAQTMPWFGGRVTALYPCTCSTNYLLVVTPPGGYVFGLFDIYPGMQGFLSYNIYGNSAGAFFEGSYSPGSVCPMYIGYGCVTITTQGTITFMTGSSPI